MRRLLLLLLLLIPLSACREPAPDVEPFSATGLLSATPPDGFARAESVRPFHFPEDHAEHPDYRNEWWYFTGNLESDDGSRFGYQVTFFRFAMRPPDNAPSGSSWADNPIWMAHVAITDAQAEQHLAEERLTRSGPALAGVQEKPFRVWLQDWQLYADGDSFPWRLDIKAREFSLQLALQPTVGVVLQGDRGLSQKSAQPGNASYYYSFPRLQSRGSLTLQGKTRQVSGLSWLDREWGTSALSPEQTGWDWFSLQLNSGEDLMYYQLRNSRGEPDPFSAGTLVSATGQSKRLDPDAIELTPERWWQSPTGKRYPVEWSLRIKSLNRTLRIKPVLDDQEMDLSVRYWEGAVDVYEQEHLAGQGYLEMTGY